MANLNLIRDLCERNRISIKELAQRVDRDPSAIQSSIRRGSTNTQTLEAIAKVLGVSAGVFFDGYANEDARDLKVENEHLKELLVEKERLIAVLLEERNKS